MIFKKSQFLQNFPHFQMDMFYKQKPRHKNTVVLFLVDFTLTNLLDAKKFAPSLKLSSAKLFAPMKSWNATGPDAIQFFFFWGCWGGKQFGRSLCRGEVSNRQFLSLREDAQPQGVKPQRMQVT